MLHSPCEFVIPSNVDMLVSPMVMSRFYTSRDQTSSPSNCVPVCNELKSNYQISNFCRMLFVIDYNGYNVCVYLYLSIRNTLTLDMHF